MGSPKYIAGIGNPNGDILFLGDFPGKEDEESGEPFVGKAGGLLDSILEPLGLNRGTSWFTNVYHHRPPDNKLSRWSELNVGTYEDQLKIMWNEINHVNPKVIVALSNTALKATTQHSGIHKWRGSVLPSIIGHQFKIIPTYHTADILWLRDPEDQETYEYWQKYVIQLDIQKALKHSLYSGYKPTDRILQIARSSLDVYKYLNTYRDAEYSSIDIETFNSCPICIGIAMSTTHGISIPLVNRWKFGRDKEWVRVCDIPHTDLAHVWKLVAEHLYNPKYKKIGQNFKFDQEKLHSLGFYVSNFFLDTMLLGHTLTPEFPKNLGFLGSIYTDEPYHKDEGKLFNPRKDNIDDYLRYNAKDAMLTLEVALNQLKELEEHVS